MIDLRNTYVVIRTQEEYENILKIAGKQGFHWYEEEDARPFVFTFSFPYILHFRSDYIIGAIRKDLKLNFIDYKCYEASELIKEKELTAREFIKGFYKIRADCGYIEYEHCNKCKLNQNNTKCEKFLCDIFHWENNEDELIKIMTSIITEQKAIECVKNFIHDSYGTLDEDIVNALGFVVKKIKEK